MSPSMLAVYIVCMCMADMQIQYREYPGMPLELGWYWLIL